MGREEPGGSHPIINEWGRAWAVPEPECDQSVMQYFSVSPSPERQDPEKIC
jgi:hypothetical protein